MKKLCCWAVTSVAAIAAVSAAFAGCAAGGGNAEENYAVENGAEIPDDVMPEPDTYVLPEDGTEIPAVKNEDFAEAEYAVINCDGLNLRAGAGTEYGVVGCAEKATLYPLLGKEGGWYKTNFRGKTCCFSAAYASVITLPESSETIEKVISEGEKLLGTPYVYGATRYTDGNGRKLSGFTADKFDCSSLMQYIFAKGAGVTLDVTTRTQSAQGVEVARADVGRGDLMFFTNSSRKNRTGVERIGHVALYLGGGYILHTASDYAKIEKISPTRESYFVTARRIIL